MSDRVAPAIVQQVADYAQEAIKRAVQRQKPHCAWHGRRIPGVRIPETSTREDDLRAKVAAELRRRGVAGEVDVFTAAGRSFFGGQSWTTISVTWRSPEER